MSTEALRRDPGSSIIELERQRDACLAALKKVADPESWAHKTPTSPFDWDLYGRIWLGGHDTAADYARSVLDNPVDTNPKAST